MKDLLECYYSSVRVVRIPKKGRYMLIDEQVSKLHQEIGLSCNDSFYAKRRARMLSNSACLPSISLRSLLPEPRYAVQLH